MATKDTADPADPASGKQTEEDELSSSSAGSFSYPITDAGTLNEYSPTLTSSQPDLITKNEGQHATNILMADPVSDPSAYTMSLLYKSGPIAPLSSNLLMGVGVSGVASINRYSQNLGNLYSYLDDVSLTDAFNNPGAFDSKTVNSMWNDPAGRASNSVTHWLGRRIYSKYGRIMTTPGDITQEKLTAYLEEYLRVVPMMYNMYYNCIAWRGAARMSGKTRAARMVKNMMGIPSDLFEAEAIIKKWPIPPAIHAAIVAYNTPLVSPNGKFILCPSPIVGYTGAGTGLLDQVIAVENYLRSPRVPTELLWHAQPPGMTNFSTLTTTDISLTQELEVIINQLFPRPGSLPYFLDPVLNMEEWAMAVDTAPGFEFSAGNANLAALPCFSNSVDTAPLRMFWRSRDIPNRLSTTANWPVWLPEWTDTAVYDAASKRFNLEGIFGRFVNYGGLPQGITGTNLATGLPSSQAGGVYVTKSEFEPSWQMFQWVADGIPSVNLTPLSGTWSDYTPVYQGIADNVDASDIYDFDYHDWLQLYGPPLNQIRAMARMYFDTFYECGVNKTSSSNDSFY